MISSITKPRARVLIFELDFKCKVKGKIQQVESKVEIGCDLIEIDRLKNVIARQKTFLSKHFLQNEINYFAQYRCPYPHIAGYFAAKEAVGKALGCGMREPLSFSSINLSHDQLGKPLIYLVGEAKRKWSRHFLQVTISHTLSHALAVVLATQTNA